MNAFLSLTTLVAAAAARPQVAGQVRLTGQGAPTLVRAPAHDSASIEHHRLGGNFAYSTAEAHAFAEVVPQISTLTHPVAETIQTHIPAPIATHQPAPIVKTTHVAQPIFKNIPTFGTQEIHGPVRTHQTITQPLIHETRTHTTQQVSQAFAAPVHETVAVPVQTAQDHVVHGVAYAQAAPVAAVAAPVAVAHGAVAAPAYAGAYAHGVAAPAYAGYAGAY
jgi:hypothetical protein